MDVVTFPQFIPHVETFRDLTGLEELVMSSKAFREDGKDAACVFVRGSAVSAYGDKLYKVHSGSDIDLVMIDARRNRTTRHLTETLENRGEPVTLWVDINHLNAQRLLALSRRMPDRIPASYYDLVLNCHCVKGEETYRSFRTIAMEAFLRLGLAREEGTFVTPSGAMKVINQGILDLNPLRWWSIEYAFKESPYAEDNVARYVQDVERMLEEKMDLVGAAGSEAVYEIPYGFANKRQLSLLRAEWIAEKVFGAITSDHPFSNTNFRKLITKGKTLILGVIEGKYTVDALFPATGQENDALIFERTASYARGSPSRS